MAFITINGHQYPAPARGMNFIDSTVVNSGRNVDGSIVAQKVGRRLQKMDNLVWLTMDPETLARLTQEFENFFVTVTYPDFVHNQMTTRTMYPGDISAEPYSLDENGLPTLYINVKVNLIDCGW